MKWLCLFLLVWLPTPRIYCYTPPVENVTVVCHNFQTVVYWNHSRPDLNPLFTVELRTSNIRHPPPPEVVCSDQAGYHCDVSKAMGGSIRAEYRAYVTATSTNEPRPEHRVMTWFSYEDDTMADHRCLVDLPPVNISVQSGRMNLSFRNPFHVYKHSINQSEWKHCKEFEFKVKHLNEEMVPEEFTCLKKNLTCEVEMQVKMTAGKHCVSIEGLMGTLRIISPNVTCSAPPMEPGNYMSAYVVILSVLIPMVVISVLVMIAGLWTRRSSQLPKSIASMLPNAIAGSPLQPERPSMCAVDISGSAPLIQTPDTTPCHTPTSSTPVEQEQVLRLHIGLQDTDRADDDVPPSPDDRPAETEYEPKSVSGYESRPRHFPVFEELEPGDVVEGYRTSDMGGSG